MPPVRQSPLGLIYVASAAEAAGTQPQRIPGVGYWQDEVPVRNPSELIARVLRDVAPRTFEFVDSPFNLPARLTDAKGRRLALRSCFHQQRL